jgi:23S rRNA (pseudouridine1915-N3)-methyltransferase
VNIEIVCVGHTPKPHEAQWLDDYVDRSQKFAKVHVTRLKELPTIEKTWVQMEAKIPKQAWRVVLDSKGKLLSTEQLGKSFDQATRFGKKSIAFLIGGSYGLPKEALASADLVMSLTPLTLPHRIALLVLSEQIYRVLSWKSGAPYHHE